MGKSLHLNRRGFLKSSAMGATGALMGTPLLAGRLPEKEEPVIIRRQLGNTDIELPIVSFGVMRSDNPALVKAAYNMGFVHFDTAHVYQEGRNEVMLGELFREIPREKIVLATKVGADGVDRQTGEPGPETTKEGILTKFEASLNRLQMKYVDILYLHGVSSRNTALFPPLLEAFDELKKQGKVRYVGMSTHRNEPEVIQAAIETNFYNVLLTAINFKHAMADQIKEKAALAGEKGIGMVAMKTMAGGFMDKERQHPIDCRAALKWVLQDKNFHTSIPGIVSFDQMTENFGVMENLELTETETLHLEEAKLTAGLYCDGCGQCVGQCTRHLPVYDFMRAYMYTYGYRNFENAYGLLEELGYSSNPCSDCSVCTVNCSRGFNIAGRIADIARLYDMPKDMLV